MATSSGVTAAGWRRARIHLIYYNLHLLLLPLNLFSNSTTLIGSDPQRPGEATLGKQHPPGDCWNCGMHTGTDPELGRTGQRAALCWAPLPPFLLELWDVHLDRYTGGQDRELHSAGHLCILSCWNCGMHTGIDPELGRADSYTLLGTSASSPAAHNLVP